MSRWWGHLAKVAALVLAVAVPLLPLNAAQAHGLLESGPTKLRIEITDAGFPGDYTLEVEEGSQVEMTFVWDQRSYPQDEHIMVLDLKGQKLETDKISIENKESTIRFIASKPGNFDFKCDLDCEVHDYLRGVLKVKRGAGGASGGATGSTAPSVTPTNLTLTPSTTMVTGYDTVSLMAALKDKDGKPVSKAEVRFFIDAEFGGVKGPMEIGVAKTDANGVAFYDYKPTVDSQKQTITVKFEGMGLFDESKATTEIQEVGALPPAYKTEPIGLDDIRGGTQRALAIIILGVWATFGFVMFQAVGISRVRTRR